MPRYRIKLDSAFAGMEQAVIDDPKEYEVGERVSLSPRHAIHLESSNGMSITATPGVTLQGTVESRE